jgi:hypothetical protein
MVYENHGAVGYTTGYTFNRRTISAGPVALGGNNSPILGGKRQDEPDSTMLCWMLALARNGCLAH